MEKKKKQISLSYRDINLRGGSETHMEAHWRGKNDFFTKKKLYCQKMQKVCF